MTALACGSTVEVAATKAGISRMTAHRRMQDPVFQRRLAELKADMVQRSAAMLTASAFEAGKTLLDLLNQNTAAAVRLGAAKAIIELGVRLRESNDLAERLTALEQQMQTNQALGS